MNRLSGSLKYGARRVTNEEDGEEPRRRGMIEAEGVTVARKGRCISSECSARSVVDERVDTRPEAISSATTDVSHYRN